MTLKIHADSHLDHGLTDGHVAYILDRFRAAEGFLIRTIQFPADLPEVECRLRGPIMGDAPVREARMVQRPGRDWPSRVVVGEPRLTNQLTVVMGPHDGEPCVLYTAYGGACAPREPGDPSLAGDAAALAESVDFWAEHALIMPAAELAEMQKA